MARLIINEGQGPRPLELREQETTLGGSADCDIVLQHESASGRRVRLETTTTGHRAVVVSGDVLLNEEFRPVADLLHNDTLRLGETMVLYKNPEASLQPEPQAPELVELTCTEELLTEELLLQEVEPLAEPLAETVATTDPAATADPADRFVPTAPTAETRPAPVTSAEPFPPAAPDRVPVFRRPLPPGYRGPKSPPPRHPGRPPR